MKHTLFLLAMISFSLLGFSSCSHVQDEVLQEEPIPIKKPVSKRKPKHEIAKKKMSKGLIVIDPGHGGTDKGAFSMDLPGYQEKWLTLSTAEILRGYLEKMGYNVVLSRQEDVFVSLEDRAEFANTRKARLFVSIHYNSAPKAQAEGIEIFYYKDDEQKTRTVLSKKLGTIILKHLIESTHAKTRGVKHGNYAVIRETLMPAVLVEGGFLTNPDELKRIKNAAYLKKVAWGVALGIQEYLEKMVN